MPFPIYTFAGFDLVLLGDIHKRQVLSKADPIIFYPGSLVQQNFGESFEGHGYAIVDLENNMLYHIPADGYVYEIDTTVLHTFINTSNNCFRTHLVVCQYV